MDGINNQKRNCTANRPHQLLVSDAVSALTHLASGRRGGEADCALDTTNITIDIHDEVQSSEESSTATTKGDAPNSSSRHQEGDSHGGDDDDESFSRKKPPPSKAETIKTTVISRLHRPEDMVKRNMFAVEGKSIRFPVKLMFILDECNEFEHIISWSDDGAAFILHDAAAFEDKVLPQIFKEARFSSFLRKKFRKGNYSMCVDIVCSNNATDVRRAQNRERKNATSPTINGRSSIVLKNGFATSTSSSTANSKRKSSDGVQNMMAGGNPTATLAGTSTHGTTISSRNDELLQETNSPILQSSIASSLCNDIISKNNIIERQRQLLQLQIEEQEKQERQFRELLSSSASISSLRSQSNSELNSLQNNLIRYQRMQKVLIKELLRGDGIIDQEVMGNQFTQEQDTSLTLLNSLTNQGLGTGTQVPNGTLAGPSGLFPPHRLQDGCRIHSQVMSAALEGLLSSEQQNDPISPQSLLLGVPAPPPASENIQNAIQQELQPRDLLSTNIFSSNTTSATQNNFVLFREEVNNVIRDLSTPNDLVERPSVNSLPNLPQSNTPRVNDFNILLEMARKIRNRGS